MAGTALENDEKRAWRLALLLALTAFAVVLLRTAHIIDDAYISFRSVFNLVEGHGLTWNVTERVQAFTNPLWVLVLSAFHFFTREIYFTSLLVSVAASLATAWLLAARIAGSALSAFLAIAALVLSKSFVDYSTSGMENPLTHLLLVLFFIVFFSHERHTPRTVFLAALAVALLMVNRMDTVLLVGPALAWMLLRSLRLKTLLAAALGFMPFLAWEVFSLFYYGFPFPNTAYAKLNTDVWAVDLLVKGLGYLGESFDQDPLTLTTVFLAAVLALASRQGRRIAAVAGAVIYLLYILKVGGDFMGGRLISAPFLVAVVVLARFPLRLPGDRVAASAVALFLVFTAASAPRLSTLSGSDYGSPQDAHSYSKSDMRAYYYQRTGLLRVDPLVTEGRPNRIFLDPETKHLAAQADGERTPILHGAMGFLGWHVGPDVYVIDVYALTDPFLARLPAVTAQWKPGHYLRKLPAGYLQSLRSGENRIRDPRLARIYDAVRQVTTGPLLSAQRWEAMLWLNTGAYRKELADDAELSDPLTRLRLEDLGPVREDGAPLFEAAEYFSTNRVEVDLGGNRSPARLDLSVGGHADYRVELLGDAGILARLELPRDGAPGTLSRHRLQVPAAAGEAGIERVRITVTKPYAGSYHYALGHLLLE